MQAKFKFSIKMCSIKQEVSCTVYFPYGDCSVHRFIGKLHGKLPGRQRRGQFFFERLRDDPIPAELLRDGSRVKGRAG